MAYVSSLGCGDQLAHTFTYCIVHILYINNNDNDVNIIYMFILLHNMCTACDCQKGLEQPAAIQLHR